MWGSIFTTQIQQVRSANVVIYHVCLSPSNQHCFPVAICLSSAGKITPPGGTTL